MYRFTQMKAENKLKKILIILFLALFFVGKICAFETFKFSVAPKYALQNGQLDEFVLYSNGKQLSELNWENNNISLLGVNATMGWEMILLETNMLWGIPKSSGMMYDSDWQNTSNYGMKTNYSESSNNLDLLGDLQVKLGIDIKTWDFLHIIPYLGLSYYRIKYTATGGTCWYGDAESQAKYKYGNNWQAHLKEFNDVPYTNSLAIESDLDSEGDVISYEREMFNYQLGVKAKYNFFTRFTLSADFALSVFTQVNSLDHHILRNIYFLDKMTGLFSSFDTAAELDVKIWKGLSAGAGFRFNYLTQLQGIDYIKNSTDTKFSKASDGSKAAADGYFYNIEAFVRYSF